MSSSSPTSCEDLIDEIWKEIAVKDKSTGIQFISQERLKYSLNSLRVAALLRCSCGTCATHRAEAPAVDERCLKDWITASAPKLFALLSYSGCPQLIRWAFKKRYGDTKVELNIRLASTNSITREFWPSRLQYKAEQVEKNKHEFFVPTLNGRANRPEDIQVFDVKTILPFTDQEPLGRGAFGHVYAFTPTEEYRDFKENNRRIPLVRKEISDEEIFPDELRILLHVRSLNNQHIVRLITAYRHGNKLNFVFPRADTNLQQTWAAFSPLVFLLVM